MRVGAWWVTRFCWAWLLAPLAAWAQPIVYVDDTAVGANDGSSWADAFVSLQDGLAAAVAGGQVWIAAGTYKPDQGAGYVVGDIEAAFELPNDVAIYGHFLGSETTLGDRDLTDMADPLRQTTLDGDLGAIGNVWDNTNNVVRAYGVSSATRLDGCTIQNGYARTTVGGVILLYGGGLYISSGAPTISHCTFTANQAINGGGVANANGAPNFVNCAIVGNIATSGGGMSNSYGTPVLDNCVFTANEAAEKGGGMAEYYGDSTLNNCSFFGNFTTGGNAMGGGMYVHAGTYTAGHATLTNCLFNGNLSGSGGGMKSMGVSTLLNCTFVENTAYYESGAFGTYIVPGNSVTNCIFQGNTVTAVTWSTERQQISPGVLSITYSFIEGCVLYCSNPNDNNIGGTPTTDPGMVDPNNGDFRLAAGSPCIGAGDPSLPFTPGAIDLDGHPRVLCGRVDMGAYEFGIGDFNCDAQVDLVDFASWDACVTGPDSGPYGPGCEAFDFEADTDVDLTDFAELQLVLAGVP